MSRHRVVLSRHQTFKEAQAAAEAASPGEPPQGLGTYTAEERANLNKAYGTVSVRRTAHGFTVVRRSEVKEHAVRPVSVNAVGDGPGTSSDVGQGSGQVKPRKRGGHRAR